MGIIIENPDEVFGPNGNYGYCVGSKLISLEVLKGDDAYCTNEELLLDFENGKEMRIYIDQDNNICVYTD